MTHTCRHLTAATVLLLGLTWLSLALAGNEDHARRADALLTNLFEGRSEAAGADFDATMRAALPPARLDELVAGLNAQVGSLQRMDPMRHGCQGEFATIWRRMHFERMQLDAHISFDGEGQVNGLFLVPPEDEQACADAGNDDSDDEAGTQPQASTVPEGVRESAVQVGAEGWPLPGVLTVPSARPAIATVVFVHGSGPHDADQTVFGNKPFRDLAHGLAAHGIASLRYVKRSKQHPARMLAETPDVTIDEEAVDDAVAAVAWLQDNPDAPNAPVFVLGHSLGGLLAPRIGERASGVAGLILIAAPSRPVEDLIVEQIEYLAPLQGIDEAQVAAFREQRDRVKTLACTGSADSDAAASSNDGPLPLGLSAAYWCALRTYDPIATSRDLDLPMLILHGERDYQVTLADLDGWRQNLRDRPATTVRSYPALNHLLQTGTGPSSPAEYQNVAPVDAAVIDDIADWLREQTQS